jgi:glycosyltransferase involved in cell wall biosynthesis
MTPTALRSLPADVDEIRVDIVIDNHDYGRFVADAVESALAQTHPSVRVIAVDDGSSDDSRAVLARYADRVDVVLKENGGQASALNAGLARCDGDVVIFLDADDVLRPDAAAAVARAFAREPRAVQVQSRLEVVDAAGRRTGAVKPPLDVPLPSGDLAAAKLTFPFDMVTVGTSGNAFRTDAVRRIGPIPERAFSRCADWYLVQLVPLLGPVAALEQVTASYRVHGDNSYEPQGAELDLDHVRQTIAYAAATRPALEGLADELGLRRPFERILSVSDLANRLVSLRLEPQRHPFAADSAVSLAWGGTRAARRRFDVPPLMKIAFTGWFWAVAAAPRPVVVRLALLFLFRERRGEVGRLLRRIAGARAELSTRGLDGD